MSLPPPRRLSGAEILHGDGHTKGLTVLDFWRWSASDLLSNAMRGVLAEWIVGTALGCAGGARIEWAEHDLCTASGVTIEVKSAAYVQAWKQSKPSAIAFDIGAKTSVETETKDNERRRRSDVYVFALLAEQDRSRVDPLDLDQWRFFVLARRVLDERIPKQKTISLAPLLKLGPAEVRYDGLRNAVELAASQVLAMT